MTLSDALRILENEHSRPGSLRNPEIDELVDEVLRLHDALRIAQAQTEAYKVAWNRCLAARNYEATE